MAAEGRACCDCCRALAAARCCMTDAPACSWLMAEADAEAGAEAEADEDESERRECACCGAIIESGWSGRSVDDVKGIEADAGMAGMALLV